MSKFLNIFGPAAGGTAIVLTSAYMLADQFVVDVPAPLRGQVVRAAEAASETPAQEVASGGHTGSGDQVQMASAEVSSGGATAMAGLAQGDAMPASVSLKLGRPATEDEIAAWDIDIRPDGQGLPEGRGTVAEGEPLYTEKCSSCHGVFGEAVGRWPVLSGGEGTLDGDDPVKTIGSYWPYLSTVYDYVHRAMPFGDAQSLTDDEVYAITAYLLFLNFVVEDEEFELSHETFAEVRLPNEESFFLDDRPETELAAFSGEVCMENCKESVEITGRSRVVDVTPDDAAARKRREAAAAAAEGETKPEGEVEQIEVASAETEASTEPEDAAETEMAEAGDAPDPELVAAGETVFKKCQACHQVGEGAKNRSGPVLNGVVGHPAGGVDGFKYSGALTEAAEGGLVWTEEELSAFLQKPRSYMKGTKMGFSGLSSEEDRAAVIAYLKTFDG